MSNTFTTLSPLRAVRLSSDSPEATGPLKSELHEKALEKSREEGYEAGRRDAEAAHAEAIQQIKAFQSNTLEGLVKHEESLFSEAEQALPELILEGVRRIIEGWQPKGEEIEKLVHEILAGLGGEAGPVRVFLSPGDNHQMRSLHEDLEREFPGVAIIEDPQLRSGECYVRGRFGITDGRFAAKLENMRKVFL
ncbi:MAG: FliH/SctL family protein [Verrucomicrobia bacterium]|nr:FliH/SctL family protein [Verrucomicrobiota bacterium]